MLVSSPIATATAAPRTSTDPAPTPGPAPTPAPGRPAIPVEFFNLLRTARSGASDALTGLRQLDRTAPLTDTPATMSVLGATRDVVKALRAAAAVEGVNPKLQNAVSIPVQPLMGASLLLSGTIKVGGPARTDLVLDQLDTELSNAWMTATRLLTKLGQPLEV